MQSRRLPGSAELRGVHKINHCRLHCPAGAPGPLRLRKYNAVRCQVQTPSKSKGSGVVMRELPLPGSETRTTPKQAYVSRPATQQASNGQTYSAGQTYNTRVNIAAAQQDAARRNSNQEASTSSSPSSVTFEPYQKSSIVRANGAILNGNQRRQEAKTYDVTTSVNQAAPGFTAASISASASNNQRAESLIAEAEGQSETLRMAVATGPAPIQLVRPSMVAVSGSNTQSLWQHQYLYSRLCCRPISLEAHSASIICLLLGALSSLGRHQMLLQAYLSFLWTVTSAGLETTTAALSAA